MHEMLWEKEWNKELWKLISDGERNVPDGSFTRTWECPAALKDEAKVPALQLRLSKDTSVTLVPQTPQSPLPFSCNSVTFHYIQRSDYSRSFGTHTHKFKARFKNFFFFFCKICILFLLFSLESTSAIFRQTINWNIEISNKFSKL